MLVFQMLFLVFIYFLLFYKKWRKKGKGILLINTIFYIYICMVLSLTILPIDLTFDPKWKSFDFENYTYANIKPFNDIILGRPAAIIGVILNIIMTIPYGFLYSYLSKNINFMKVAISTLFFSLSIELTQFIITIFLLNHRHFDVTDLITNVVGGCIGYIVFLVARPKALEDRFNEKMVEGMKE